MPAAEDKVVLQVSLQIQDAMKRLKKIEEGVEKVKKVSEGALPGAGKKDEKAAAKQEQVAKKTAAAADARKKAAEKQASILKKQTDELIKQEKLLNRMAKKAKEAVATWGKQRVYGVSGRGLGGAARAAVGAPMSVLGALYGFTMGGLKSGYAAHQAHGMSRFGLTGLGARGAMRGRAGAGLRLGFTVPQTMQQAAMTGRQTGAAQAVNLAQQFAFAGGFGTDVGGAAQVMGQLRESGLKFGLGRNYRGKAGSATWKADRREDERIRSRSERTMREMISAGMYTGLEKAKLPEFYQSVSSIAQDVSTRQFGQADIRGISTMLASFAKGLGISAQRASKVMGAIDQGIRAPGGGEAGQALMMQAFGFGKPGGQTGFYDALKMQQRGLRGGPKGSAAKRLQMVFDEINRQYGTVGGGGTAKDQRAANYVLSQVMPQLTLDQIEKIQDMINSGKSQEDRMEAIKKIMDESKPIDQQALEASKEGFAVMAKHLADIDAKSAGIGAKAAKIFQTIQKWQMGALDKITDYIPQIMSALKSIAANIELLVKKIVGRTAGEEFKGLQTELGKGGVPKMAVKAGMAPSSVRMAAEQNIKSLDEMWKRIRDRPHEVGKRGDFIDQYIERFRGKWFGKKASMEDIREKMLKKVTSQKTKWSRMAESAKRAEKAGVAEIPQAAIDAMQKGRVLTGAQIKKMEQSQPPPEWLKRKKTPKRGRTGQDQPQSSTQPRIDNSDARSKTSLAVKNPDMSGEPGGATTGSVGSARP